MSGLYIHIPFCKQKCSYCNFHFSTARNNQQAMVDALCQELSARTDFLPGNRLTSAYFGGGTPSLLTTAQVEQLFDTIHRHFLLEPEAEVTLEANPDDIDHTFLSFLKAHTPINRLSIGVQSFRDDDLKLMNRAHNSSEALKAIDLARGAGFRKFNMDLIFGTPGQTIKSWEQNLRQFLNLDIDHVSCYSLTIEKKTALHHWIKNGTVPAPDDDLQADLFLKTSEILAAHGYEQYEISNYCRHQRYAQHNTNYWKGVPYLGIGPSAHSFDGKARYFNFANNARYLQAMQNERPCHEHELLTPRDRYNEYVMTGLRTKWGIVQKQLDDEFADYSAHFRDGAGKWLQCGYLSDSNGVYTLSPSGKLLADTIITDLFF